MAEYRDAFLNLEVLDQIGDVYAALGAAGYLEQEDIPKRIGDNLRNVFGFFLYTNLKGDLLDGLPSTPDHRYWFT